jgi:DnaJ-class molecular chaperone
LSGAIIADKETKVAKDLYQILGVAKTASEKEISSAYRTLAKKLHPDLNPGDAGAEERFKELASAYAVLRDPETRERYDRGEIDETGAEKPQQRYYRHHADQDARHQYSSTAGYEDFVDLDDLFAEAFARRRGGGAEGMRLRGADVRYHLEVDLLEAVNGAKKRVTMPDGATLDISIPAGIESGQTMRLKGKGGPGYNDGPPGDALVTIEVRPHRLFRRDGNTISIDLPITIDEAVLGAKVEVPTTSGRVKVTIPKGATSGQTLRLRGKGIKTKSGTGDQLVRLQIVMPDTVDEDLEAFMTTWSEKHRYNPRAGLEA